MRFILAVFAAIFVMSEPVGAQVDCDDKCDDRPTADVLRWTILNSCNERIDLAVRYQTKFYVRTAGWWGLEPGAEITFNAYNNRVAYYVKFGSQSWDVDPVSSIEVMIDTQSRFDYEPDEKPEGADTIALFHIDEILNDMTTSIGCQG